MHTSPATKSMSNAKSAYCAHTALNTRTAPSTKRASPPEKVQRIQRIQHQLRCWLCGITAVIIAMLAMVVGTMFVVIHIQSDGVGGAWLWVALTAASVIVCLCVVTLPIYCRRNFKRVARTEMQRAVENLRTLDKTCPNKNFTPQTASTCCLICLDDMTEKDTCRKLECAHCFHADCLESWALGRESQEATPCPVCRRKPKPHTKRHV
mmetsp:Transcript_127427/g.318137  ORF Transcript_127427/g.318137 Transcript_127427/m.318137 type:complete len:208 (+) Transcript_127427:54-677(+)